MSDPGPIAVYACACGDTLVLEPRQVIDCCRAKGIEESDAFDRLTKAVAEMGRALNALRLEVPAEVMVDMRTKWNEVLDAMDGAELTGGTVIGDLDSWELLYTNNDDGVWLRHLRCRKEINLGFFSTMQKALDEIGRHQCSE
jgi:hypothetical protein